MTGATRIINQVLDKIPSCWPGARLWRQNVGGGVGRNSVRKAINCARAGDCKGVIEALSRPMMFGVAGAGDTSGAFTLLLCRGCRELAIPAEWKSDPVCACGVNSWIRLGVRTEIEVKDPETGDTQRETQENFEEMCNRMGIVYILAHGPEEARASISAWLERIGVKDNGR